VDSLNAAKKQVIRRNKIKYMGDEASKPIVREETQQIYNGVADRLNAIIASIGEINAQLNLTAGINAPWASKAIDRYISATSSAKKQIADLNSYLEQHAGTLGDFSEAQLSSVASLNNEMTTTFTEIIQSVSKLSPKKQLAIKKVFSVFIDDLSRLNQILEGNVGYRSGVAPTANNMRGVPVKPFITGLKEFKESKSKVVANPDQEVETEASVRKVRKDKGVSRKKTPKTPSPRTRLENTSGSDADTLGGGMCGGLSNPTDRVIGGSYHHLMRRINPISFPAAMSKGGLYLDTKDYMPTRFL